jgi:hypothetical protein
MSLAGYYLANPALAEAIWRLPYRRLLTYGISSYREITGRFEGKLQDQNGNVIVLPGLWGISFGAGQPSPQVSGPGNALFFNAGINMGTGGLFGTLTPVSTELFQGGDQ